MIRPAGWTLTVAGPDESGMLAGAKSFVAENEMSDSVEFVGPAYGEAKRHLLARAEIFALPTLGESFGVVVAEALAAGVPVITTRGAPRGGVDHAPLRMVDRHRRETVGRGPARRSLTRRQRASRHGPARPALDRPEIRSQKGR